MESRLNSIAKKLNSFSYILSELASIQRRINANFDRLPEEEQSRLTDYHNTITRELSDISSDMKGYISLLLKHELGNIAAMDINDTDYEQEITESR